MSPGVSQQQFSPAIPLRLSPRAASDGLPNATLPAETASVDFRLAGVEIRGVTRYDEAELLQPWQELIGDAVTVAQVYELTNDLRTRYRNDGYLLAQVVTSIEPTAGSVTAEVVEGAVADVQFTGELRGRDRMLDRMAGPITATRPVTLTTLEQQLLLINDLPGVTAYAVPEGAELLAGAARLTIEMDHQPVDFDFGVRNRASELIGPEQYDLSIGLNSLFRAYENTTIRVISSGDDRLQYGSLEHSEVLGPRGKVFSFSIASSDSVPELGADFQAFNLTTNNDTASVGMSFPLTRSRDHNLSLRARITRQESLTDETGFELTRDVVAALRIGVTADHVANWFRAPGLNVLDAELSRGLDAFDASQSDDPLTSRAGGEPEFSKLTLYAAHLQSMGPRWSLLLAMNAQYAFDNVLAPEEFAYGGEFFGRGYDASEFVGDNGVAAKIEVRFTLGNDRLGTTLYVFADGGSVSQEFGPNEEGSKPERESATAAGIGVRFNASSHFSGYVEFVDPLSDPVAAEGNDDARVFAGLRVTF